MESDRSKLDVLDFIITILKEHTEKICSAADVLEQVAKHGLDAEKLYKLEELIVFQKATYDDVNQSIDNRIPPARIIKDLDKLLEAIRK